MGVFVISPHPGLLIRGNLDLTRRPIVVNRDGSISTVKSVSFGFFVSEIRKFGIRAPNGLPPHKVVECLVPQVIGKSVVSAGAARQHFIKTGQHLGIFDSPSHATAYAQRLHVWQAKYYRSKIKKKAGSRG